MSSRFPVPREFTATSVFNDLLVTSSPQKRETYAGKPASWRGGDVDGRPGRDWAIVGEVSGEGWSIYRRPVEPLELSSRNNVSLVASLWQLETKTQFLNCDVVGGWRLVMMARTPPRDDDYCCFRSLTTVALTALIESACNRATFLHFRVALCQIQIAKNGGSESLVLQRRTGRMILDKTIQP